MVTTQPYSLTPRGYGDLRVVCLVSTGHDGFVYTVGAGNVRRLLRQVLYSAPGGNRAQRNTSEIDFVAPLSNSPVKFRIEAVKGGVCAVPHFSALETTGANYDSSYTWTFAGPKTGTGCTKRKCPRNSAPGTVVVIRLADTSTSAVFFPVGCTSSLAAKQIWRKLCLFLGVLEQRC